MSSAIETLEMIEQVAQQRIQEKQQARTSARRGVAEMVFAFIAKLAVPRSQHARWEMGRRGTAEMFVDILAQEHPYTYIKSMA